MEKHDISKCEDTIENCYECFKEVNKNTFKRIFTSDSIFKVFKKDDETKEEFVERVLGY